MKINIKFTNIEVSVSFKKIIEEKIKSLEKIINFFDKSPKIFIEIAKETRHHKKGNIYYIEINIITLKKNFRVQVKEKNIYKAINLAKKEMKELLASYKEKIITRKRIDARKLKEEIKKPKI